MIDVMTTIGESTFAEAPYYLVVDNTIRICRNKTDDELKATPSNSTILEMALFNLEYILYVSVKSPEKTKAG